MVYKHKTQRQAVDHLYLTARTLGIKAIHTHKSLYNVSMNAFCLLFFVMIVATLFSFLFFFIYPQNIFFSSVGYDNSGTSRYMPADESHTTHSPLCKPYNILMIKIKQS